MNIHSLDVRAIPNTAVILALGRRKSGKTVNILTILNSKKDVFDGVLCFCGSSATRLEYAKHIPRRFIYDGIDIGVLEALVNMQEEIVEKKQAPRKVLILIDDCGYQTGMLRKKVFRQLAMNGRHMNVMLILSLQYSVGILPAMRGQVDYVLCSQEKSPAYRRKIFDHYSVAFRSFKAFDSVMRACTVNFESFVIAVAASRSSKIEDNVFFFKSKYPIPNFRMVPTLWKSTHDNKPANENKEKRKGGEEEQTKFLMTQF